MRPHVMRFATRTPYARPLEPVQIAEWGELNRRRVPVELARLDDRLAQSAFLAGDRFSVADITLFFVLQGAGPMGGPPIPEDATHLRRWYEAASARPSALATQPARS